MENLDDKIKRFLEISDGYGGGNGYSYNSGDGYSNGNGYGGGNGNGYSGGNGNGSGDGNGNGSGDGDVYSNGSGGGNGNGSGNGDGDGLKKLNGHKVYNIDGVQTIIYNVHGAIAQGAIVTADLVAKPCYIAREGDYFAHGETARQAATDAHNKYMQTMPEEDRIRAFVDAHPSMGRLFAAKDLFEWHNILTGSCKLGRENFCREKGIDLEKDSFTVIEFVELTRDAYGGNVIEKILSNYKS